MSDLRVSFPKPCCEAWEGMAPAGCDRRCAQCDTIVHDLAAYTLDEAEALLRANPENCVRARIDANGVVALKPSSGSRARRMVIAAGASVGLLAAGTPARAGDQSPAGRITGTARTFGIHVSVIATGAGGRTFRTKVDDKGRYTLKHVPADTYTLTFKPDCGYAWTTGNVVVADDEVVVPESEDASGCIVVGLLRIDDHEA